MTAAELIEQGNDAITIGEVADALNYFQQATQADPQHIEAWQSLAMAHYKLQQYSQAAEAIKKAITLKSDDPVLWASLSMIEMKLGHIEEAEAASAKSRILSWGGKIDA
jgi:Flp pilus assembly protein TadD